MVELNIGETVRQLRKYKGITQEQLAEIIGVSVPAVSKWESGQSNPDLSVLPIIARYFNVTLDFLFTFSREPSPEDLDEICTEIANKFSTLSFVEAQAEWCECLRQYPTCYPLMYQLSNIAVLQMSRADSEKERLSFVRKILDVLELCTKSEDLHLKQGAYYQMANIYISIDEFEHAQKIIDKMPQQVANPQFVQSALYVQKGEHEQALKTLKESLLRSMGEMYINLGMMISNCHKMSTENTDFILDLHEKRHKLTALFGMESYCLGAGLEIAQILAERKEYKKMRLELEKEISLRQKYPLGQNASTENSFFHDLELLINFQDNPILTSTEDLVYDSLQTLVDQIFSLVEEENSDVQDVKSRLKKVLS